MPELTPEREVRRDGTRPGDASAAARHLPGTAPLSGAAVTDEPGAGAGAVLVPLAAVVPGAAPGTAGPPTGAAPAVSPTLAGPVPGDEQWATPFGFPGVADAPSAVAVRGREVFLGGSFTGEMAGLPADTFVRVAWWDGSRWRPMGEGVDAPVHAIAVVGEDVYVGGEFTVAGGTAAAGLARWDGTSWSPVAGGVATTRSWAPATVRALASDGATLFVAGAFEVAGSGDGAVAAAGVAALDLATGTWTSWNGGLGFLSEPGEGRALAVAGGRLYVGGYFDRAGPLEAASLAAVDLASGAWQGFGAGVRDGDLAGSVDALAVDPGTGAVDVGGRFTAAGDVATSGVATLTDGRWGDLGGLTYYDDPRGAAVVALARAGGRLYAAGTFTAAGGVEVEHWAVHDREGWGLPAPLDNAVVALAAQGDDVVVAGAFGYSGALRVIRAATWTGDGWQTFGQGLGHDPYANVLVYTLAVSGTGADAGPVAGGFFDQAGPVPVASVARWHDGSWHDAGGGVQSPHVLGEVFASLRVGDDLYVTGQFESAGGTAAANIARWDGQRWHPLGGGVQGAGYALALLAGRLYVGGGIHRAGDVVVSNVASWDPVTGTWAAVGSVPTYDGPVFALAAVDDRCLVVGGIFSKLYAGRFQVSGMNSLVLFDTHAPPDPADPWAGYSRLPGVTQGGLPGVVSALQLLGDEMFVGGTFDTAGVQEWADPAVAGFPAANLATWHLRRRDGGWSTPGVVAGPVKAFATLDGRVLVVGGGFGSAGGVDASGVAELDPAAGTWTAYGSGVGGGARGVRQVEALAQSAEAGLWVAGTFTVAGGVPACGLALWRGTAGRAP